MEPYREPEKLFAVHPNVTQGICDSDIVSSTHWCIATVHGKKWGQASTRLGNPKRMRLWVDGSLHFFVTASAVVGEAQSKQISLHQI